MLFSGLLLTGILWQENMRQVLTHIGRSMRINVFLYIYRKRRVFRCAKPFSVILLVVIRILVVIGWLSPGEILNVILSSRLSEILGIVFFPLIVFSGLADLCKLDKEWAQKNISQYRDFNDFVIRWVSCKENIFSYVHFQPQYHFICHPVSHKIAVDFVGFYENLEADCAYIQRKIFGNADRTLLRTNTTKGKSKDYKEVYTDTTKEIVAHVYAKDIELLGYNFDNSSLPAQIANRPV